MYSYFIITQKSPIAHITYESIPATNKTKSIPIKKKQRSSYRSPIYGDQEPGPRARIIDNRDH